MSKAIFNIEHGELNKKCGLLLPDDIEQVIVYEIDDITQRPIRELGRIKLNA